MVVFAEPISQARFREFLSELQLRTDRFAREELEGLFLSRFGSARVPAAPDDIDPSLRAKYEIIAVDPERVIGIRSVPLPDKQFRMNPLQEMKISSDLKWTGAGIKVAVLDSGLECDHPDFMSRSILRDSKVKNLDSCDKNGHGTHCTGLIAGPRVAYGKHPGYGAAPDVTLMIIRALDNDLLGDDGDILKAMNLAADLAADIIVMCMSADVPPVAVFENDAAGIKKTSLIIAAAGNDTSSTTVALLGHPANAPSIMAVAAVDDNGGPWEYSAGSGRSDVVEVAAPGEGILSSYFSRVAAYQRDSGTSQAAAYAAGVAALWAHSDAKYRGEALREVLRLRALDLGQPDLLGKGLVQAPA
ncbi:MAG: S8 family serine peptidase [Acidobacteriota bacterium]